MGSSPSLRFASRLRFAWPLAFALVCALGCGGNPLPGEQAASGSAETPTGALAPGQKHEAGELVTPPFEARGELEGLLLVWFDAEGSHIAQKRSDIPEASRKRVRIDALNVAPDERLDPEHVYVADLTAAGADGRYAVRKHTRAWLEAQVESLGPQPTAPSGSVTLYMASWCGACRSAAKYFREKQVQFVERDIEQDAAANAEMQQKAQAAGKTPRGVPVIDFRGTIVLGFDRARLDQLIAGRAPI